MSFHNAKVIARCVSKTRRGAQCENDANDAIDRMRCKRHAQMRRDAFVAEELHAIRTARGLHATNLATVLREVTGEHVWPVLDESNNPAVSMSIGGAEKLFAAIQFAKAFGADDGA